MGRLVFNQKLAVFTSTQMFQYWGKLSYKLVGLERLGAGVVGASTCKSGIRDVSHSVVQSIQRRAKPFEKDSLRAVVFRYARSLGQYFDETQCGLKPFSQFTDKLA